MNVFQTCWDCERQFVQQGDIWLALEVESGAIDGVAPKPVFDERGEFQCGCLECEGWVAA